MPDRPAPITDWRYAGFLQRLLALILDIPVVLVASTLLGLGGFLYVWLMIGFKGQTLGKMAVGIRVVDRKGEVPDLGQAALREIMGKFISGFFFALGYIWALFDPRRQSWHDKIADTYVVRVPRGLGGDGSVPKPPLAT